MKVFPLRLAVAPVNINICLFPISDSVSFLKFRNSFTRKVPRTVDLGLYGAGNVIVSDIEERFLDSIDSIIESCATACSGAGKRARMASKAAANDGLFCEEIREDAALAPEARSSSSSVLRASGLHAISAMLSYPSLEKAPHLGDMSDMRDQKKLEPLDRETSEQR